MIIDKVEKALVDNPSVVEVSRTIGGFARHLDFTFMVGDREVFMGFAQYHDTGSCVIVRFCGNSYSQWFVESDAMPWEIVERIAGVAFYD
jgi:hypothetical protein